MENLDDDLFARQREEMVRAQIQGRGISNLRILQAMREVPRHRFVPAAVRAHAYEDCALPIGHRQTISQPYIVALMLELARLAGNEHVLEIGTGSGYATAILASLCRDVVSVERIEPLARRAQSVLDEIGRQEIHFVFGDGSEGYAEGAPYDAIIVWAAAARIPPPLLDQLSPDGVLVVPEGRGVELPDDGRPVQMLVRYEKRGKGLSRTEICPVSFVPLIQKGG